MTRRRAVPPVALLALVMGAAGCAGGWIGPAEAPPLPPLAAAGPEAPARNAIQGAADAFGDRAGLAGRPAEAAIALARLEWLAEAVPLDLMFTSFPAIAGPAVQAARSEARRAAGIAPDAPAVPVMAALDRAAAALLRPDGTGAREARAALAPPAFAPDALARIAALPFLRQAAAATALLRRALEFGPDDRFPPSMSRSMSPP